MNIILLSTGAILLAVLAVFGIGLALPDTRTGTSSRVIDVPAYILRAVILDVEGQPRWRSGIVAVERTSSGWIETTARGERIHFQLSEQREDHIGMMFSSSYGYHGRWNGRLTELDDGSSLLEVTEQATTPSPIGRIFSRLFFDPEAYATAYLVELWAEAEARVKQEVN
ncbi:MAG: hypothetical protein ACK4F5_14825 [Aliihoeflea sp.]